MKLTRYAIVALALGAVLALAGCSGTSSKGGGRNGSAAEPAQAQKAESDYAVTIDGVRLSEDYEGNPAVVVTFSFTNNSDEAKTFLGTISVDVYQNGVECDSAIGAGADSSSTFNKVKPGATAQVEEGFVLSDTSEIEIEVSELFSFSNDLLASGTFTLE